jgi:pimeloyl-ACP methyl ester carboxylesterase
MNAVQHCYAMIDGTRMHWVEMGKPTEAPPIVLLHGINDSHLTWELVAPLLAAHRHLLMPDFPGCGLSERPDASYELAWHARMIAAWLSHVGLKNADIVGHSFGGGVAQMLLLECPERIRRLALVAPGGLGRGVGPWLRLAASLPSMVELFGQPFMALGTRLTLTGPAFSAEQVMKRCAMNATAGTARAFARTARDVINWRGQTRLFLQHAHKVATLPPIAVYWGDRDDLVPFDDGAAFAQAVKNVLFHPFPGCGHYLHHEQPSVFVNALREFLDRPYAEPAHLPTTSPLQLERTRALRIPTADVSALVRRQG